MKDIFHTRKFKILLCAFFVLAAISLFSDNNGLIARAINVFALPTQRISTLAANNGAVVINRATASKEELLAENKSLRKYISELETQLVEYYDLKKENAQLYKYLDMKQKNPDFKPVAASVIGRDPNSLYTFTIDQGTHAGISINDPVITDEGVVGWISAVGSVSAEVTTILSPDTKIGGLTEIGSLTGAADKVTGEAGVISTNIILADQGLIKLGYLSADTESRPGDIVVTSGLGGLYPANLKIGHIRSIEHEEYDISLYALVEPFVDVTTVRDVMILTEFEGQGEILIPDKKEPLSSSASSGENSKSENSESSENTAQSGEESPRAEE